MKRISKEEFDKKYLNNRGEGGCEGFYIDENGKKQDKLFHEDIMAGVTESPEVRKDNIELTIRVLGWSYEDIKEIYYPDLTHEEYEEARLEAEENKKATENNKGDEK